MNRRHPDPDPVRCALDRAHRETPPVAAAQHTMHMGHGGADPPLVGNIGSKTRKGRYNRPGRQDTSVHARCRFADHVNTDVHH